jgi:Phage integrase, N-terminal SAM-like domain
MLDAIRSQRPKLLDGVRQVLRLHHDSMHTERSSMEWIVRFVRFHGRRLRAHPFPAEPKIEAFLTNLAVHGHVAGATQNQAMNALVFLYRRVLDHVMEGNINAVGADKKVNVPVVMIHKEIAAVISLIDGTTQLVAKLLHGSGLHIMKAVRLRVKTLHQPDLAPGHGKVHLPPALARNPPCRHGMGVAVGLPRPAPLRSPAFRDHPSPSRGPQRPPQGHQGGRPPCRSDEDRQRSHLSPCLRHSPAPTRPRHPHLSAPARAQRSCHDHALYPHPAAGRPGCSEPPGRPRCLAFLFGLPNADQGAEWIRPTLQSAAGTAEVNGMPHLRGLHSLALAAQSSGLCCRIT